MKDDDGGETAFGYIGFNLDYSYSELQDTLSSLSKRLNRPLQETIRGAGSKPLTEEEISLIQSLTKANVYDAHR